MECVFHAELLGAFLCWGSTRVHRTPLIRCWFRTSASPYRTTHQTTPLHQHIVPSHVAACSISFVMSCHAYFVSFVMPCLTLVEPLQKMANEREEDTTPERDFAGCVPTDQPETTTAAAPQAHRTEEMRDEARRFASEVAHLPYKEGGEGMLQMVAAAFRFHPAREQRRRVHAETVACVNYKNRRMFLKRVLLVWFLFFFGSALALARARSLARCAAQTARAAAAAQHREKTVFIHPRPGCVSVCPIRACVTHSNNSRGWVETVLGPEARERGTGGGVELPVSVLLS